MRLAAIICAWSDTAELLPYCIRNIEPVVNKVFVIYSETSNKWVRDDRISELVFSDLPCQWVNVEPLRGNTAHENETRKRNYGLKMAKDQDFTHFMMMDADEFYIQDEVIREKNKVEEKGLNGLVCPLKVFIKKPTLWCEDHTLVPFIQRLTPITQVGHYVNYPFNLQNGQSRIDPTRRVNHFENVEMSDIYMYHFSYVRKDMELKINNSSANLNRARGLIYEDMENAAPGYVSKLYHKELKEMENIFNLPEFV